MNKKDKNSLVIIGVLLVYVGLVFGLVKFTKFVNPYVLFGISAALQCIIIKPQLIANFYKLNNMGIDNQRFIPILNEFAIFTVPVIRGELIFAALTIVIFGATQLPLTIWAPIFGQAVAINMPFKLMVLGITTLFVSSLFRGVGYIKVARDTKKVIKEYYSQNGGQYKESIYSMFGYVSLLFPVVRIIGLIDIYSTLNTAVKLKGINTEINVKTFKEVDE